MTRIGLIAAGAGAWALASAVWPLGGIRAFSPAAQGALVSPAAVKPDESRFTANVLVPEGELDEPMMFSVLPDERVLIIERKGALKVYEPAINTTSLVATIPVNTKYISAAGRVTEAEEGLFGLTIDPAFERNRWIYMKYAEPDVAKHVLARWELRDLPGPDGQNRLTLVAPSKRVVLEHFAQRERCCHTGGGMAWDRNGNLYITVGNNTGGGMTDERPGYENSDDQKSSANTNDLRGKILRIHPEPDGTYTIPPGNLFPPGTPGARPEIYTMGHRNPWRVSIDSRTGYVYWGEVGPADGRPNGGATPYDELNQARGPGFFGFPYFVGPNEPVAVRDYIQNRLLPAKDPLKPTNTSVNNTGLKELPPAVPAFIAYSYDPSERFPLVGSGAQSAVGGPVYHRSDFAADAPRAFPAYYEGKWLAADFERGWIMAITMNADSEYVSMERFVPAFRPHGIIDLKFAHTGDLYVLDYGSTWFAKSPNASLVRIEYTAGNRRPKAAVAASARGGALPFTVDLSSAASADPDGDPLKYSWRVAAKAGSAARTFAVANPRVPFTAPGVYTATLTVTDAAGLSNSASVDIVAGNAPPDIAVAVAIPNQTFFTVGSAIPYAVKVTDREDAAVAADRVAISADYVPATFDVSVLERDPEPVDASSRFAVAKAYIANSNCAGCHQRDAQALGPSFTMLAGKYTPDAATLAALAKKVIAGGSKVWGEAAMPPHPGMSPTEAAAIVQYMLSVNDRRVSVMPLEGRYTPAQPEGELDRWKLALRAVYTDQPVRGLPSQTTAVVKVLRAPVLSPALADVHSNVTFGSRTSGAGQASRDTAITAMNNGHVGFRRIDMTGIRRLQLATTMGGAMGAVGGAIEVRLGSPAGQLIGQATVTPPPPQGRGARGQNAGAAAPGSGPAGGVNIDLTPSTGFQDVFLVFKNERARGIEPLVSVLSIRFAAN